MNKPAASFEREHCLRTALAEVDRLQQERNGHKRGAALLAETAANNLVRAEQAEQQVADLRAQLETREEAWTESLRMVRARAEQAERQATALLAENARVTRTAYVLAMDLLQSRDQLWRADDVVRAAVEKAIAADQEGR